jgi:putative ABC transport system ATP-binding protein
MLLAARGLTYARPAAAGPVPVFSGLDLALEAGELVDMRGPSGSGKTTLLLALARLLPGASADAMELDGRAASSVEPETWRAAVALLPQKPALVPGTVLDNLLLPWTLRVRAGSERPGDTALRTALDSVGLTDVELDRPASRLSAGQVARVALLRIVATRPRVMLLDEPDSALDDGSAELVGARVREFVAEGGAVVRVRHLRVDAAADRCLRLADGRLSDVTP